MTQTERASLWNLGISSLIKQELLVGLGRQLAIHAEPLHISDDVIVIRVDIEALAQKRVIHRLEMALRYWKPHASLFVTTSALHISPEDFLLLEGEAN